MVHEVERLGANLEPEAISKQEIADDAEIKIHKTGAAQNVASGIPKTDARRSNERRGVKPVCGASLTGWQIAVGNPVWTRRGSSIGRIGAERGSKWLARLNGEDTRKLPVAKQLRCHTAAFSKRNLIKSTHHESTADIEVR